MRRRSFYLRARIFFFRLVAQHIPWILGGALLLGLWSSFSERAVIPSPGEVYHAFLADWQSGALIDESAVSLLRVGVGYSFGTVLGVIVALLSVRLHWFKRMIFPYIDFGRTVSPLALSPVLVLWFHKGPLPPIVLIAFSVFFPTVLNWHAALFNIPDVYLRVSNELNMGLVDRWRKVILPAIAPAILTATRIHFSLAWIVVIAIEMLSQQDGLGSLVMKAQTDGTADHLFAAVMNIAVLGAIVDFLLRRWQKYPRVSWGYGG